ncbi:MAG TPA: DUF4276 family protein [bacterium]|nr:DUF4276 family protein [bacterium]
MTKVLILVEGQTEEEFIRQLVYDYLWPKNVFIQPKSIPTRRVVSGPDYKGGLRSYPKINGEIRRLLGDSSASAVTMMYDYYGLPTDFPGRRNLKGKDGFQKVRILEAALARDINDPRFIPYIQLHEFEGLLFSSPVLMADTILRLGTEAQRRKLAAELQTIRKGFRTPEDIDDNPEKHPSKRIAGLAARYQKVKHGILIAKGIGIEKIREQCPHFNEWLTRLEKLSQ